MDSVLTYSEKTLVPASRQQPVSLAIVTECPLSCCTRQVCTASYRAKLDHAALAVGHADQSSFLLFKTRVHSFIKLRCSGNRRHRETLVPAVQRLFPVITDRCAHSNVPSEAGPGVLAAVTTPKVARTTGLDSVALAGFSPPQVHFFTRVDPGALSLAANNSSATPRTLVSMASGWTNAFAFGQERTKIVEG